MREEAMMFGDTPGGGGPGYRANTEAQIDPLPNMKEESMQQDVDPPIMPAVAPQERTIIEPLGTTDLHIPSEVDQGQVQMVCGDRLFLRVL